MPKLPKIEKATRQRRLAKLAKARSVLKEKREALLSSAPSLSLATLSTSAIEGEGECDSPKPSTTSQDVSEASISMPVADHVIEVDDSDIPDYDEKFIISRRQLEALMEEVMCRKRKRRKSFSAHVERERWDSTCSVCCDGCRTDISHVPPARHGEGTDYHAFSETNLQEVHSSLITGVG